MSQSPIDPFIIGEINATVKGTAEDVKAIRTDLGDMNRRVTTVEQRVEAIETERAVMIPEYNRFTHKVNNHLQADTAWKARFEGHAKGGLSVIKVFWGVALACFGALVMVAARALFGV